MSCLRKGLILIGYLVSVHNSFLVTTSEPIKCPYRRWFKCKATPSFDTKREKVVISKDLMLLVNSEAGEIDDSSNGRMKGRVSSIRSKQFKNTLISTEEDIRFRSNAGSDDEEDILKGKELETILGIRRPQQQQLQQRHKQQKQQQQQQQQRQRQRQRQRQQQPQPQPQLQQQLQQQQQQQQQHSQQQSHPQPQPQQEQHLDGDIIKRRFLPDINRIGNMENNVAIRPKHKSWTARNNGLVININDADSKRALRPPSRKQKPQQIGRHKENTVTLFILKRIWDGARRSGNYKQPFSKK